MLSKNGLDCFLMPTNWRQVKFDVDVDVKFVSSA